jgi:hypothetical protein
MIKSCLEKHDFFASDFSISQCGLNENVLQKEHLVYVKRADGKEFFIGVINYKTECALSDKNPEYAHCVSFTLSKDQTLEVIVGTNQHVERGI